MDEVKDEPLPVRAVRCRSKKSWFWGNPAEAAIVAHSSNIALHVDAPLSTATICPMFPRIRQVAAPKEAS
jgi:hypothetical protein